jgi:cell division protein FtsZ
MENNELIEFGLSQVIPSIIKVVGIGGGGSNAVNYMYSKGIHDVEFVICNTDVQALAKSPVPVKIQLGITLTEGLGAGNEPEQGKQAAIESIEEIKQVLSQNTKMVFLTVGLGGGTGTGAAPIIAQAARELDLLSVGIVTIPFRYEGKKRLEQAMNGLEQMKEYVDALLVIDNEKIREIYGDLPVSEAFSKADDVLNVAAKGIAEIITVPGHINVDFADVKTVMSRSGVALMGMGTALGEQRAINAVKEALTSPLLNNNDIRGAHNLLLNIGSGASKEATMDEVAQIIDFVQEAAGQSADVIFGIRNDNREDDSLTVTLIATGFNERSIPEMQYIKKQKSLHAEKKEAVVIPLNEDDLPKVERAPDLFNQGAKSDAVQIITDPTDSEKIDAMHNVPAYRRNKGTQENSSEGITDQGVSKYTVSGKGKDLNIRDNNPYLHDNVD